MQFLKQVAIVVVLFAMPGCEAGVATWTDNPPSLIGSDRPARLLVPKDYDPAKRYPLAVELHGYGVNSALQDVVFGLGKHVDSDQFVLLLPEGSSNLEDKQFWHANDYCCDFDDQQPDDVTYLSDLIEETMALVNVDDEHVTVLGHSNGGYMSYRMACARPDLINRILVIAAAESEDDGNCESLDGMSLIHVHGVEDTVVPYRSTMTFPTTIDRHNLHARTVGAEAMVDRWAARVGCIDERQLVDTADYFDNVTSAETQIWSQGGCPAEVAIELWRSDGVDHFLLDRNQQFQDAVAAYVTAGIAGVEGVR